MSTNYESTPRASAAGVTTAAILVVMLAMGASTQFATPSAALALTPLAAH